MKNKSTRTENKERTREERIFSSIKTIPPSDGNFKEALKDADADMIRRALSEIQPENNQSRIKILRAKLNSLEKARPKVLREDLQKRKVGYESQGWEFEFRERTKWSAEIPAGEKTRIGFQGIGSLEEMFDLIDQHERERSKKSETSDNSDGDEKTVFASHAVRSIPVDIIFPSPFEAQERRRRVKFETPEGRAKTDELGESILATGLLQPIAVRPNGDKFEIIYGERRWLAHKAKNLSTILAFVRDLPDADVHKAQHFENHQREKPDELEDALRFKNLIENEYYSEERIASEYNETKQYVRKTLRLNKLIPEAVAELADGSLPLKHAYYLATFSPVQQARIVEREYAYKWQDKTNGAAPFDDFEEEVSQNIVRDLGSAPFDTNDPKLHILGLTCFDCPERTGNDATLFKDEFKGDKCRNESCFTMKSNVYAKNQLRELAEEKIAVTAPGTLPDEMPEETFQKVLKTVPIVTEKPEINKKELAVRGTVLTNQIVFDTPECEFSTHALQADGEKKNQKRYFCANDDCPVHHPEKIAPKDEKSGPSDYELQQMERKFQIEVGMTVRERVLAKSIEYFTGSNSFWQYADLVEKLIVEFVLERSYYLKRHAEIFKVFKNFPKDTSDRKSVESFVGGLDQRRKDQLLFLIVFCRAGYMSDFDAYRSQAEIEKLANAYAKIDYGDLDAEVRVELAPDDFKETAAEYRDDYRNYEEVVVPRFWWADFEFPD